MLNMEVRHGRKKKKKTSFLKKPFAAFKKRFSSPLLEMLLQLGTKWLKKS